MQHLKYASVGCTTLERGAKTSGVFSIHTPIFGGAGSTLAPIEPAVLLWRIVVKYKATSGLGVGGKRKVALDQRQQLCKWAAEEAVNLQNFVGARAAPT